MAVVLHEIVDSDFEYVLKATTTGTNSAASLVDASAAEGVLQLIQDFPLLELRGLSQLKLIFYGMQHQMWLLFH